MGKHTITVGDRVTRLVLSQDMGFHVTVPAQSVLNLLALSHASVSRFVSVVSRTTGCCVSTVVVSNAGLLCFETWFCNGPPTRSLLTYCAHYVV